MDDLIGVNLRREDPIEYLNNLGFVREYHAWVIDEGDSDYPNSGPDYPNNAIKWSPGYQNQSHTQFPQFYQRINQNLAPSGILSTDRYVRPLITPCRNCPVMAIMPMNAPMLSPR